MTQTELRQGAPAEVGGLSRVEARYQHMKKDLECAKIGSGSFHAFSDVITIRPIQAELEALKEKKSGLNDADQQRRSDLIVIKAAIDETIRRNENTFPEYAGAFSKWDTEFDRIIGDLSSRGTLSAEHRQSATEGVAKRLGKIRRDILQPPPPASEVNENKSENATGNGRVH